MSKSWFVVQRSLLALLTVVIVSCGVQVEAAAIKDSQRAPAAVEIEGFKAGYNSIETPRGEWDAAKEAAWFGSLDGKLTISKAISYRGETLEPGEYDLWIEKGKGEWYHLLVGNRADKDAPRLRTLFKLYEQDEGVEKLRLELKQIKKGSKLKVSIFAGKREGHSNFRIESGEGESED